MRSRLAALPLVLLLVSAAALVAPSAGHAQQENPPPYWTTSLDLKIRTEPLGLLIDTSIFRREILGSARDVFTDGAYKQYGVDLEVSPALADVGLHFEAMPVRLAILRFEYRLMTTFGLLGYTLSFDERGAEYGDEVEDARAGEEEFGVGHRLAFMPTLQYAVGRLVFRNMAEFYWHHWTTFDGPYVRERLYDQLNAKQDVMIANTSVVAWRIIETAGVKTMLAGAFYEHVHAVEAATRRQRVGALFVWIPAERWGNVERPRLYLQSGYNLFDRNREGAVFVQGGFGVDFPVNRDPLEL
jgi:hypothetical protein